MPKPLSPSPSEAPEVPSDVLFGRYYYGHDCGEPYIRNERWLEFFGDMAERIKVDLAPSSVLDAGCALGMLVEQLRAVDVDAWGFDVSEYAIANVDESAREFCWQGSLADRIEGSYDLVVCLEVIEHLPAEECERAVRNLCEAGDRILFSSSPHDYAEATHFNVRPPEDWAALFARHGFFRNLDVDTSFITPWAVLFERAHRTVPEAVRHYDRAVARLQEEVHQVRENIVNLQARLEHMEDATEEAARLRGLVAEQEERIADAQADFKAMEERAADMEERVLRVYELAPVRAYSWVLRRLGRGDPGGSPDRD